MPGRLIFTSYALGFCKTVLQVVGLFSLVACLINFLDFARRYGGFDNFSVSAGLKVALLKLPQLLTEVFPFCILVAAMIFLRLANRRGELTILRAAGMPAIGFLAPLLAVAAGFGLLMTLAVDPVSPLSRGESNDVARFVRGPSAGGAGPSAQTWVSQQSGEGLLFIGGVQTRNTRIELQNATFLEFDGQGQLNVRRDARSAHVQDGRWILRDVILLKPGADPVALPEDSIATTLDAKKVRWQFVGVNEISIYEMPQALRAFRDMGLNPGRLVLRLFSLLMTPFMFVAMVLIAAPMSIVFSRGKPDAAMIGGAIAAGFAMHSLVVLAQAFGKTEALPPWLAVPLPVILSMTAAWLWLRQTESVA